MIEINLIITDVNNVYKSYYSLPANKDLFSGILPFSDYLVNGSDRIILALDYQKIIGFCLLHEIEKGVWVKEAVSVNKEYRQRGIAKSMIDISYELVKNLNGKMNIGKYSDDGKKYLHKINVKNSAIGLFHN